MCVQVVTRGPPCATHHQPEAILTTTSLMHYAIMRMKKRGKKHHTHIKAIMLGPGGHRLQRPCAQGRTRAKQDPAQASAPGRNRTRSAGGATTHDVAPLAAATTDTTFMPHGLLTH